VARGKEVMVQPNLDAAMFKPYVVETIKVGFGGGVEVDLEALKERSMVRAPSRKPLPLRGRRRGHGRRPEVEGRQ